MQYIEREINTCHTAIGYIIARNWKLPDSVSEAIRDHRDRDRLVHRDPASDGLLICLKLSEQLCDEPCRLVGVSESAHWPDIADVIFSTLCISEEDFSDLEHEIKELMVLSH